MTRLLIAAALVVAAAPAAAQSNIANARIQEHPGADLAGTVRQLAGQTGPLWIGYAIDIQDPEWNACCYDGDHHGFCCGGCSLEGTRGVKQTVAGTRAPETVQLEGTAQAIVLYRVENGQVGKIRAYSSGCRLDAGGLPVHWLTNVRAGDSVALLASFAERSNAEGTRKKSLLDSALMAIAAHRDPAAERSLVHLARDNASSRVRGQAMFWLAQKAGSKAAGVITDIVENDPDTQIKVRAVFALSQLPPDEGVPKLIDVARKNSNPKVRKQAIFWLGQSKDPRALRFFEEILRQ